jgi:hypothetical protein
VKKYVWSKKLTMVGSNIDVENGTITVVAKIWPSSEVSMQADGVAVSFQRHSDPL